MIVAAPMPMSPIKLTHIDRYWSMQSMHSSDQSQLIRKIQAIIQILQTFISMREPNAVKCWCRSNIASQAKADLAHFLNEKNTSVWFASKLLFVSGSSDFLKNQVDSKQIIDSFRGLPLSQKVGDRWVTYFVFILFHFLLFPFIFISFPISSPSVYFMWDRRRSFQCVWLRDCFAFGTRRSSFATQNTLSWPRGAATDLHWGNWQWLSSSWSTGAQSRRAKTKQWLSSPTEGGSCPLPVVTRLRWACFVLQRRESILLAGHVFVHESCNGRSC